MGAAGARTLAVLAIVTPAAFVASGQPPISGRSEPTGHRR